MPNVLDIRRRIRSVINTRQITKAMKMVSAAKLRRAQERALAARPFALMLINVLRSLVQRAETYDQATGEAIHPLLAHREENNILLVVISGDKGLAGAFNANIVKSAMRFIESKAGENIEIFTVGRKGRDVLKRRYAAGNPAGVTFTGDISGVLNNINFEHANEIAEKVIQRYTRGEVDSVYLIYNEFKSVIAQRLVVEQILPVQEIGEKDIRVAEGMTDTERERAAEAASKAGVSVHEADTSAIEAGAAQFATRQVDYIYEQPAEDLFRSLLPKYVGVEIYRAILESVAAEHAARMTAMDSATNNASEMIDSLTLVMNRVRQAKITKEIIEIVSGAAAQ